MSAVWGLDWFQIICFILSFIATLCGACCCSLYCHYKRAQCWECFVCFNCCYDYDPNGCTCCCCDCCNKCWNGIARCLCSCLQKLGNCCCRCVESASRIYNEESKKVFSGSIVAKDKRYKFDANYINSWKRYPDPGMARRQWTSIQILLNVYWVLLICWAIIAVSLAHLIPIIIDGPWSNCKHLSKREQEVICIVSFHVYEVTAVIAWVFFGVMGLFVWSHLDAPNIQRKMLATDTILYIWGVFELIQAFIGSQSSETPVYQMILFMIWSTMCIVLPSYGLYVRTKLGSFITQSKRIYDIIYVNSEEEICRIIKKAKRENKTVRCIGSEHSNPASIFPDYPRIFNQNYDNSRNDYTISLDNLRDIEPVWDNENMRVTVSAGMLLGLEETKIWSRWSNSLSWKINQRGWALSDTGGVVKQSCGGFTVWFSCVLSLFCCFVMCCLKWAAVVVVCPAWHVVFPIFFIVC